MHAWLALLALAFLASTVAANDAVEPESTHSADVGEGIEGESPGAQLNGAELVDPGLDSPAVVEAQTELGELTNLKVYRYDSGLEITATLCFSSDKISWKKTPKLLFYIWSVKSERFVVEERDVALTKYPGESKCQALTMKSEVALAGTYKILVKARQHVMRKSVRFWSDEFTVKPSIAIVGKMTFGDDIWDVRQFLTTVDYIYEKFGIQAHIQVFVFLEKKEGELAPTEEGARFLRKRLLNYGKVDIVSFESDDQFKARIEQLNGFNAYVTNFFSVKLGQSISEKKVIDVRMLGRDFYPTSKSGIILDAATARVNLSARKLLFFENTELQSLYRQFAGSIFFMDMTFNAWRFWKAIARLTKLDVVHIVATHDTFLNVFARSGRLEDDTPYTLSMIHYGDSRKSFEPAEPIAPGTRSFIFHVFPNLSTNDKLNAVLEGGPIVGVKHSEQFLCAVLAGKVPMDDLSYSLGGEGWMDFIKETPGVGAKSALYSTARYGRYEYDNEFLQNVNEGDLGILQVQLAAVAGRLRETVNADNHLVPEVKKLLANADDHAPDPSLRHGFIKRLWRAMKHHWNRFKGHFQRSA